MGNAIDKEGEECKCDTLARDITYKNYSNEKLNEKPPSSPAIKSRHARGGSKLGGGISRSNSKSRRQSFKGRKAVGSIKRAMSREKKSAGAPAVGLLLSDMEIQVDGKVAKLVPRKSIVSRMPKPSPKIRRDSSNNKAQKNKKATKPTNTAAVTDKPKSNKTVAAPQPVTRKPSYEAAVSAQNKTDDRLSANLSHTKDIEIAPKPEWNHLDFSQKHIMPSKDLNISNTNNNNCNRLSSAKQEFSGIWRIDESSPESKVSKRRSSGCEVYREISSQLSKLALVSPISDV